MNFAKYIDNRFQEVKVLEQAEQIKDIEAFPIKYDAEIKALHMVLQSYRSALKWFYVPKVFIGFALVKCKLIKAPSSPLLDKIKADLEVKKTEEAKKVINLTKPTLVPSV